MNPHLALLVSSIYPGSLAPIHREDLDASTLTTEIIQEQLIRSVPPAMIPKLLGSPWERVQSALLFPFPDPRGGIMPHVRMKVFPSLTDEDGHTIKYLQPPRTEPRVYFVVRCLDAVCGGAEPLYVVEGEKKALAVAQLGAPTIGICGVEGWHVAGSRDVLADFDWVKLAGRAVKVIPDGDYQDNPNVYRAIQRFGSALRQRGADPAVVLLPSELP